MTAFRKARENKTDWARVRGLTDAQIDQAMREDDAWRDLAPHIHEGDVSRLASVA